MLVNAKVCVCISLMEWPDILTLSNFVSGSFNFMLSLMILLLLHCIINSGNAQAINLKKKYIYIYLLNEN